MRTSRKDRGIALIIVLFLAAVLTLMMYAFLREMQVEYSLASSLAAEKQAEQLALSAIEKAGAVVTADVQPYATTASPWYNNADEWYEMEISDPDGNVVGVYTAVRANAAGETAPLFGLMDEASKINLNMATREQLMKLPRMTDEIADSIIDWRDADENPTGTGGENAYYLSLQPGYACKNAPFDTVEELLLVKGVTPEILYGEDVNQNGILDRAEDDADKNAPAYDNADGVLDPGLVAFVTVWSYDRNIRGDGTARVNINTATNPQLTEALGDVLSPPQINAIAMRRQAIATATNGPGFRSGADLMDFPGIPMGGISREQYVQIADRVKTVDAENIPGLINVNTATKKVLETIADWTPEEVAAVIEHRTTPGVDLSNVGWLVNVLPVPKVQSGTPFLTVRSWQFRIDAIGRAGPKSELAATDLSSVHSSRAGVVPTPRVMKRLAAVFDKAATPQRLMWFKDVSKLGLPYPVQEAQVQ